MEYFEVNQQKFYPDSKDPNPKSEWEKPGTKLKAGQLKAFNLLAKQMANLEADASAGAKERLLTQAKGELGGLRTEAEETSGAYYIKTMERMLEKGAEYAPSERARLKGMVQGKSLASEKKESFEHRINILKPFVPKKKKVRFNPILIRFKPT